MVEHLTTAGVFTLDGQSFDVDNNVWILSEDDQVIVVDAPHDAEAIARAVGNRQVEMIVCTHGHNDHVNAAVDLSDLLHAPVALHPDDRMLWDDVHAGRPPDIALSDGQELLVGATRIQVISTPGHSPGSVSLLAGDRLFSGDTLFQGGPGATGRSHSDFPTIIDSIRTRLLVLPAQTVVYTGHGDTTTIADEAPHLEEWIRRGH